MDKSSTSGSIRLMQSNLQKVFTSHQSEWPSSKYLQTTNAGEVVEKREPSCTVVGKVNWYSYYGEQYGGSSKNQQSTTIWPSNPTTGHISWENHNSKRVIYHNVHCSSFTIARTWKQPKWPSTDEWIKKMWHIYTMEYYSAIKINKIEFFVVRWMDLESVIRVK